MIKKRLNILTADYGRVAELQRSLTIHYSLCKVLVQRGIDNFDKARSYFRPMLSHLHDPYLMKDMDKAVKRVRAAINSGEKILVFGDYDVDGTTSVACMYRFLTSIYDREKIDFYIPHRYREGYGVSKIGIDFAQANHFSLIISLDCGIKSADLVAYAKKSGIDFIICDHHLPDSILPAAAAILNPKQPGCNYPYKELCGCGVGFKLITAMVRALGLKEEHLFCYLDLVATAIAADIVPITGENRVLTYFGLKKMNENPCPGIRALKQLGAVKTNYTINNVVFVIAPRVNAAGRMDDAKKAVKMFVEDDFEKALEYAQMLQTDNIDRKDTDAAITEEAFAIIDADEILIGRKSTVLFKSHWHKGVVGIVASRLMERYYRPTVVLTQNGEIVTGSARSVAGFNLYEAIHACRDHLIGYGGHFAAAGLTMLPEKVGDFSAKFEETVGSIIEPHLLMPEIIVDAELSFRDLKINFFNILAQMEPFGPENLRPVFITRNVLDTGYSKIVKELHIRFVVKQDNIMICGIGFNLGDKFDIVQSKKPFDLIYTIDENDWDGQKTLQLKVIDIRLTVPDL